MEHPKPTETTPIGTPKTNWNYNHQLPKPNFIDHRNLLQPDNAIPKTNQNSRSDTTTENPLPKKDEREIEIQLH